jgi:hypothetical protein
MKTTIITLSFLACLLCSSAGVYSQELLNDKLSLSKDKSQSLIIEDKVLNKSSLNVPLQHKDLLGGVDHSKKDFSAVYENTAKKKKKSIGLGILLSALIPGAGELYGESYLKAAIFFGVELLAWGTYFYFDGKGNKKTEEYYAYADQYWDIKTYARWLKDNNFRDNGQINPDEPIRDILEEQIRICERANFSHTLPIYKSQQYYELIGKYQNFQAGWTNLAHVPDLNPTSPYYYQSYRDPIFTNYALEREKANDFYEYAKIGPVTAIVNHILSAADAAWVISTYNKKIKVETGFRLDNKFSPYTYRYVPVPTFNVNVNF